MPHTLRLCSWNVLADAHVRPEHFPLTPPGLLAPGVRAPQVLDLALSLEPDVVAFQEADEALADLARSRWEGWDVRWCPKSQGRPDGCLTMVRRPLAVVFEERLVYSDGSPVSGHVAHVLGLSLPGGELVVVNTHVRYGPPSDPDHVGVREVSELTGHLAGWEQVALAADLNDLPDGPVRSVLAGAGYRDVHLPGPTSLFGGDEPRALDVVSVRGLLGRPVPTGVTLSPPLPGPACPSDHVPLLVDLEPAP